MSFTPSLLNDLSIKMGSEGVSGEILGRMKIFGCGGSITKQNAYPIALGALAEASVIDVAIRKDRSMNAVSSVKPPEIDLATVHFEPAMSMSEMRETEQICQSFGVQRRITLTLATKSRPEMVHALNKLKSSSDEDVFTLLDCVSDYLDHLKAATEIVEMVQARVIVATHEVFGIPFDDTELGRNEA